jgi:hypothetical protein
VQLDTSVIEFSGGGAITWFDVALVAFCPLAAYLGTLVASRVELRSMLRDGSEPRPKSLADLRARVSAGNPLIGVALRTLGCAVFSRCH